MSKGLSCLTECNAGFYHNGATCLPCLSIVISGSCGHKLIDGRTSSCVKVPMTTKKATLLYALSLHGDCTTGSYITLYVTIGRTSTCYDLISSLVMAQTGSKWDGIKKRFTVCDVISISQAGCKNVCSLKCKCADQCLMHVYSGLDVTTPDLNICEIVAKKYTYNLEYLEDMTNFYGSQFG